MAKIRVLFYEEIKDPELKLVKRIKEIQKIGGKYYLVTIL